MSVNVNASNASLRRNEVIIDLTGDDDDDDGDVPSRNQPSVQSTERYHGQHPSSTNGHYSKTKENGPSITSITSTPQGASMRASTSNRTEPGLSIRPSSQQNQHSPSLPSPFSSQAQEHPTKRRKTHHSTSHKPAVALSPSLSSTSSSTDKKALTRCLQLQVFPHLEVATKRLDQNVYDVEKLGGRIIGRIANKEFERHFRDGNGKLASDIEVYLIVKIHQLVTEFTAGNVSPFIIYISYIIWVIFLHTSSRNFDVNLLLQYLQPQYLYQNSVSFKHLSWPQFCLLLRIRGMNPHLIEATVLGKVVEGKAFEMSQDSKSVITHSKFRHPPESH